MGLDAPFWTVDEPQKKTPSSGWYPNYIYQLHLSESSPPTGFHVDHHHGVFCFGLMIIPGFFLLHIGKNCGVSLIIYRVALYIPADDWHASILCPSLPADTGKTSNLSCLFALFTSLYPGILMISLPTMDYMEILHDFLVSIVIFTVSLCACLFHFFQKTHNKSQIWCPA